MIISTTENVSTYLQLEHEPIKQLDFLQGIVLNPHEPILSFLKTDQFDLYTVYKDSKIHGLKYKLWVVINHGKDVYEVFHYPVLRMKEFKLTGHVNSSSIEETISFHGGEEFERFFGLDNCPAAIKANVERAYSNRFPVNSNPEGLTGLMDQELEYPVEEYNWDLHEDLEGTPEDAVYIKTEEDLVTFTSMMMDFFSEPGHGYVTFCIEDADNITDFDLTGGEEGLVDDLSYIYDRFYTKTDDTVMWFRLCEDEE